jgi:hypothetical protein
LNLPGGRFLGGLPAFLGFFLRLAPNLKLVLAAFA